MKTRHVFVIDSVPAATAAVAAARKAGIEDGDISLIARSDIEMEQVPRHLQDAATDFVPAAMRGALTGGSMGLVGGLIGVAVPPIGLTVAGVGLATLAGAAVGTWVSALVGSSVPNEVQRRFESEIEAGRILIVVDAADETMAAAEAALRNAGASLLSYEAPSALT